jgi:hypothetical protein
VSQYEYQLLLDGGVEVLQDKSLRDLLMDIEKGDCEDNAERVRQAVINHPETQKLIIFGIPNATDRHQAKEVFTEWLYSIQAFESWSRCARKFAGSGDGNTHQSKSIPEWYSCYLETEYWQRRRCEVFEVYKSCVLCATATGKLDTHHRTYLTLGKEKIWDLSLLCDSCHFKAHRFLNCCFPASCPDAVQSIIDREGKTWKHIATEPLHAGAAQ